MRHVLLPILAVCVCAPATVRAQEAVPPDETVVTNRLFRGELVLRAGAGPLNYTEKATIEDVTSDADATVGDLGLTYTYEDPTGFKLRGACWIWISDTVSETWHDSAQLRQRNDLQMAGLELDGAFGLDLLRASPRELNLWVGGGFRSQNFERSHFRLYDEEGAHDAEGPGIDEDYYVGLFTLGVDGRMALSPRLTLGGGAVYGSVFFNRANNEALGEISGEGGHTIDLQVTLSYGLTDRDAVGVGVRYGYQELEGDIDQSLIISDEGLFQTVSEWPDNEMERFGAGIFWTRIL